MPKPLRYLNPPPLPYHRHFLSSQQQLTMEGERGEYEKVVKGPWSKEEDRKLVRLVMVNGPRRWPVIASGVAGRSEKSCRLRWCNHLSPDVQRRPFTLAEDAAIVAAQAQHGNKWSAIAPLFPGRTDNAIKNRWNSIDRRFGRRRRQIAEAGAPSSSASAVRSPDGVSVSGKSEMIEQWLKPETTLTLSLPRYGRSDGGAFVPAVAAPASSAIRQEERRGRCLLEIMKEMIAVDEKAYKEWLRVEVANSGNVLVGIQTENAEAAAAANEQN